MEDRDKFFIDLINKEMKNFKEVGFTSAKEYRRALISGYNTFQGFDIAGLQRGYDASQEMIRFKLSALQNKADSYVIKKLIIYKKDNPDES